MKAELKKKSDEGLKRSVQRLHRFISEKMFPYNKIEIEKVRRQK